MMINCPHCGETVSDKAKKCIHCGEILIPDEKKKCSECGFELEEGMTECPKCGCPVDSTVSAQQPQKVEVTGVKITKRIKSVIVIILALIILGGITAVQVKKYQNKKVSDEYSANLELATQTMLAGASTAESNGNLIKSVWYNAIYEKRDDETDKYTRPNRYFVSDFNEALLNLFLDSDFNSKTEKIEENQKTVNELMKQLKNPPEEYKEAYDAISAYYNAYISLTNCVIDPSGSLQTYSDNFNKADNDVANCYKAMQLYIGE